MHFRTVKETRKLRGFSDLFMLNRRLIIIIILIIGKGFLLLFIYYYLLFIIIYFIIIISSILFLVQHSFLSFLNNMELYHSTSKLSDR